MEKIFVLIGFIFCLSINVFANNDAVIEKDSSLIKKGQSAVTNKINNESNSYTLLYENQKETNDKLLQLLTNSLLIIVSIIVAVIGTSIFYNYRFNKKEYELLVKENRNDLEVAKIQVIEQSRLEFIKLTENINIEINKRFDEINSKYSTNFDVTRTSFDKIIDSFKKDFDERISFFKEDLDTYKKEMSDQRRNIKKELSFTEKKFENEILDLKGMVYTIKEYYGLAIANYVDKALNSIELKKDWELKFILDDIQRSINQTIQKGDDISPRTKKAIEVLISKIPNSLKEKRDLISESYIKIQVKQY